MNDIRNIIIIILLMLMGTLGYLYLSKDDSIQYSTEASYEEAIKELCDTLLVLRANLVLYESEIERMESAKALLGEEVKKLRNVQEKINLELSNGSLDDNIKFLSDFLSGEIGYREE